MKTYLLRAPKAVEPQTLLRPQRNKSAVEPKATGGACPGLRASHRPKAIYKEGPPAPI